MTEDIIEAVARALFDNEFAQCDARTQADHEAHWQQMRDHYVDHAETAIRAYEAARGDVVVVPNVPTRAMIDAWRMDQAQGRSLETSYRAMIAASQGER